MQLSASSIDYIQSAITHLQAVVDGNVVDGTGGTDPSSIQIRAQLRGVRDNIETVMGWLEHGLGGAL